jgi:hypothetical protein
MAEILVQATRYWKDNFTQAEVDALSADEREKWDARSLLGDIICIRPDGWTWGAKECLPKFIIFKIPSLSYEDAKAYEVELRDGTKVLRANKFRIPENYMNNIISQGNSVVTVNSSVNSFLNNIVEKTGDSSEIDGAK